jgi:hypothetical protein
MAKRQNPVRAFTETPIQGPSGQPCVVLRRRARGRPRARPEKSPGGQVAPLDGGGDEGCLSRRGRPRLLECPTKVLVTLEACDLVALRRWQLQRQYPGRSAAIRAMIAEVCGHE